MTKTLWAVLLSLVFGIAPARAAVVVTPPAVRLDNPEASQQLLVTLPAADGTRTAKYEIADPAIAGVDAAGMVTPKAEGRTEVRITHSGETIRIPVEVTGLKAPRPVSFEQEIIPILTKASCNSGGCHGKAEGQAGFKLSVFGFDPAADYQALVNDARGRRIFPASPENSLLLAKGTGQIPHGGGKKLDKDNLRYRRLMRWLKEGTLYSGSPVSPVTAIEVEPSQRTLALGSTQQLRVTAVAADGSRRCVTAEAEYDSNAGTIAGVDGRGLVTAGDKPGEAAILVRYMGQVTVCRVTLPRPGVKFPRPAEANFVDKHVWDKLERLGIPPSDPAEDAAFLRRVYLDTIGTLPTADEAKAYLADASPDKRAKLIDRLLDRPEYADFWALKWSDILKVDKDAVTPQGAVAMTRWIRRQFADNRPYDAITRDIVTAQGSTTAEGPAALYKSLGTPEIAARSISQVFLGVRIECAECHHHPSERWGQDDYWALAGMFSGVTRKPLPGGSEAVVWKGGVDLGPKVSKKANGTQTIPAKPLGAASREYAPTDDRRKVLADWMTGPENPFFAPAISNRLWSHYFGRGLVEPLDDMRATNPASNEPLLAALAAHLREKKYDLKAFTKTLLLSRAYQLSSKPTPANQTDEQNFSHAAVKPMPAEVLLDAVSQVTGVAEKFNGWPEGYRAIQVWDNRMPSYFFHIFGRPVRYSVCECERGTDPSIAQALHLMNSPEIGAKVRSRNGLARKLSDSDKKPEAIIDEVFLTALSRRPNDTERAKMLEAFADGDRKNATEDVLWAILNSKEFLYNR
ncbi:DUF1549 domain-containing protein [Zavarzinella formosa]|uniref:DUF1549 domain-containing protein n=1 Tax=Zavarzinella formosa TaxID=360055 RepID=UPI0002DA8AD8|nr:DUF1549 domain-containing protein [Zavarzinella formosa]